MCRTHFEPGSPPSRANANAIRDAEVTVARPQRYCARTIPLHSTKYSQRGTTSPSVKPNACSPFSATAAGSRIASTAAQSITQPNSPDTHTERTMPRGTFRAAPAVSSETCAEASKPVIVYAGNRKPSAKSQTSDSVRGQTGSPSEGVPLKFVKVHSREKSSDGAATSSATVSTV